jgi:hypothetical protein
VSVGLRDAFAGAKHSATYIIFSFNSSDDNFLKTSYGFGNS